MLLELFTLWGILISSSTCQTNMCIKHQKSEPRVTLGSLIRRFQAAYRRQYHPPPHHRKVLHALANCRTQAMGGKVYACSQCGAMKFIFHSCRNRHCPQCGALEKEKWIEKRKAEFLPVGYLHVVFTLPHQLNPLVLSNDRLIYNLLFKAVWQTLRQLFGDPRWCGAQGGMVAVLHTWGQTLSLHPHLHCIVPSGGLSTDQKKWVPTRKKDYLAPNKKVIAPIFRATFMRLLTQAFDQGELQFFGDAKPLKDLQKLRSLFRKLHRINWNVYAKRPFAGPAQIINYLSRYTHRIALSNNRIVGVQKDEKGREVVCFSWKNYRKTASNGKTPVQTMKLPVGEFIRRFLLHVLPPGFHRIRYYGILAGCNRSTKLKAAQQLLQYQPAPINPLSWKERLRRCTGQEVDRCEHCGHQALQAVGFIVDAWTLSTNPALRGPPRQLPIVFYAGSGQIVWMNSPAT